MKTLIKPTYTTFFRHGTALHCTFTLIFLPSRFKNWHWTEHRCCTLISSTARHGWVFSLAEKLPRTANRGAEIFSRAEHYQIRRLGTSISRSVPAFRPLVKTLNRAVLWKKSVCECFTLSLIWRAVPINSGTRTKILTVPCPKRYSVNGVCLTRKSCFSALTNGLSSKR